MVEFNTVDRFGTSFSTGLLFSPVFFSGSRSDFFVCSLDFQAAGQLHQFVIQSGEKKRIGKVKTLQICNMYCCMLFFWQIKLLLF